MKALFVFASSIIFVVVCHGQNVYRNTKGESNTYAILPTNTLPERGDDVMLSAPAVLTEMIIGYFTDVTNVTGRETFKIRFYNVDEAGSPTTPIYETSELPARVGPNNFTQAQRILLPNIEVPASFVWSWQSGGSLDGSVGNRIGPQLVGRPDIGFSDDFYWRRVPPNTAWDKLLGGGWPSHRAVAKLRGVVLDW